MLILHAARLAARLHHGQRRKYTARDYIEHPGRVAARISRHPEADESWVAAAWLHDVLEDCTIDARGLEAELAVAYHSLSGEAHAIILPARLSVVKLVVKLVVELTNPSKGTTGTSRATRKAMDRQHLAKCSRAARCIKLADRTDNLNDMVGAPKEFKDLYAEESDQLLTALTGTDDTLELELSNAITRLTHT